MQEKKIQIGGQAVIEGVMMRGPEQIATAIRRKDGTIDVQKKPFISATKTNSFYKLPIIRGFVSLIEMLKIGFQTLNYSATVWEQDQKVIDDIDDNLNVSNKGAQKDSENKKEQSNQIGENFKKKLEEIFPFVIGISLALVFFGVMPYFLASLLNLEKSDFLFNLFAGSLRIVLFVIYVYCISFMKEIKRVFEYHGAEHMAVFAYEQKAPLKIESVKTFGTIHPRCGTSFMFIVLLVAILVFSIVDTIVAICFFTPGPLIRFLYHLPFIPFVSGISYEVLKLSEKKNNNFLIRIFTKPGMALQKITTQPPNEEQIEVAIVALREALNLVEND